MPILGNLSEFPLPEVLLLIGMRTGRLRLLGVPEYGIIEVDLSQGEVQAMNLGFKSFIEVADIVEKLGGVLLSQEGTFEFRLQPVAPVVRERTFLANQLAMSLVCHVDEHLARQQEGASLDHFYVLELPQPEIWIEPELHEFFLAALTFLTTGIRAKDLAKQLKLDPSVVHQNLNNLLLLGLIKLLGGSAAATPALEKTEEKVLNKSNEFLRAVRITGEMQRITSRLAMIKKP